MRRLAVMATIGLMVGISLGQTTEQPRASGEDPATPATSGTHKAEAAPAAPQRLEIKPPHIPATRRLEMRLEEIVFDEAPLDEAFAQIAAVANVNLVVRWEVLEELSVERDKPITLAVRNLRLRQVLWLVLNEAAGSDSKLAFRADDDLILVSTLDDLNGSMITRVYDVNDLIMTIPDDAGFAEERTREVVVGSIPQVADGAVGARPITRRYSGGVYLGREGLLPPQEYKDDERQENMRKLIEVITTTIDPESWAGAGGAGTIISFRGRIVVRNSPLVHQKLAGALVE